jgi:anti-sigma factor RsiW
MTCAELEILLCDYLDGTLRASERNAVESHLTSCSACAELAQDASAAAAFIDTAAEVEPPAELMTRILHQVHQAPADPKVVPAAGPSWWRRLGGGWIEGILQPRYAMGMAMTVLSLAMLAKFAPINIRQLTPSDLDPVKIWAAVDDRGHRAWDRAVKYYENLRVVIEIQSRLQEWGDQEQPAAAGKQNPSGNGQPGAAAAGTNDKR